MCILCTSRDFLKLQFKTFKLQRCFSSRQKIFNLVKPQQDEDPVMRATNRNLCRITKNEFFPQRLLPLCQVFSLDMSPFSDTSTWAHLCSVNQKSEQPKETHKPCKKRSIALGHYLITCLQLTKEQLLACIKIHSAATINFPETLQIPGSAHKRG